MAVDKRVRVAAGRDAKPGGAVRLQMALEVVRTWLPSAQALVAGERRPIRNPPDCTHFCGGSVYQVSPARLQRVAEGGFNSVCHATRRRPPTVPW